MKRMQYIWSVLLACVLVSCEEKLPEFDVTTLSMKAEWRDANLYLSSDIKLSSGVGIKEQGFVLELPVCSSAGYYGSETEQRTVQIPVGESLEYTLLSEGWKEGLKCTAYAYVKTHIGNFRSGVVEVQTVSNAPQPVFTQVTHTPSAKGAYYGGGTVVIEGKHFNGMPRSAEVRANGLHMEVKEGGPGRIEARYSPYTFQDAGEYELEVTLMGQTYTLEQKMVVEGIRIVSVQPEHPRHGELVKMYLENYTPGHIIGTSSGYWNVDINIQEEAEGYITFRVPEYPVNQFNVRLVDRGGVASIPYALRPALSWEELDLEQSGWTASSLYFAPYATTYHAGKTYQANGEHTALLVFDSATLGWQTIDYPDIPNRANSMQNVKLFGYQDYLYLFASVIDWSTNIRYSYLYRMGIDNGQWELVEEVDNTLLRVENAEFAVTDGGVVYVCDKYGWMEYDLNSKTWKPSESKLAPSLVIGGRGNKVYCVVGDQICWADFTTDAQPVPMTESYPRKNFVLSDDYLYYQKDEGFYRIALDKPDAKEESLGSLAFEPPFDVCGYGLLLPASDVPCLIWQTPMDEVKLYQYIPE